jgi:hypothetical protein
MGKPKVAKVSQLGIPGLEMPVPANPFKAGLDHTSATGQSFLVPTRDRTQGMNLGQRAKFAAGRLTGDILLDSTRSQWWRYNATEAVGRIGFDKMAGGSKIGGALSGFAGIQAMGQTSGAFDATNIGQGFRPKGFEAAFPSDKSLTVPENPVKEIIGRYVMGKGGRMLPYDQFAKERPDISQEKYDKYASYLKAKPDAMPAGTFDLGGFGVLKGTSEGINGPEVRFLGVPTTPGAVLAGTGTAMGAAATWKAASTPKLGVVPKMAPTPTIKLPGGKSLQLGRTNPALAIAGGLVAGGLELQSALKDQAGIGETVARTVLAPATSVVGGISAPIQKAGASVVSLGQDFGDFFQGKYDAKKSYERAKGRENAIDQGWADAPKNLVRGILGQPAQAQEKKGHSEPAPAAPQTELDKMYQRSGDRLAEASARRKLVRMPDGSVKSVARNEGDQEGVHGTVTAVSDGDTYTVRTYDPKTKQHVNKQVRVGNIDARETADHASSGNFQNRMINKQKKEQGYTSDGAVFRQGEKDKQAASKLVPIGSVVRLNNVGEAAHDRMAATVGQEGSGKDVGEQLVASGNATEYKKKGEGEGGGGGGKGGGGGGNPNALKIAELQHAKGGTVDRTNTSRERVAEVGAMGRVQTADTTGRYRVAQEGVKQQGAVAVATVRGKAQMGTADITGRYRVAQEGVKQLGAGNVATIRGKAQMGTADIQGRYRVGQEQVRQQGQVAIADRRLHGTMYTADSTVRAEDVKNQGVLGAARYRADSVLGAAQAMADSRVRVAEITKGGGGGNASRTDADRSGYNNVKAADFGNDAARERSNAAARDQMKIAATGHQRSIAEGQKASAKSSELLYKKLFGG